MEREQWPKNYLFVLAAIGSAAGLGNLWRFPFMAYSYGGAAFVLVCVIAYIIIGYPLLTLEIALGQRFQKGAPGSIEKTAPGWGWVGIWAIICVSIIISYYAVVMGWGVDYLGASLKLAWGNDPQSYFNNTILRRAPEIGKISTFSPWALLGLAISWVLIYLCVYEGVKSVSRVVIYTVALPYILLIILIIRGVTLPGSMEGLHYYLVPKWSMMLKPEIWIVGLGQVFFSLSLAMGIMFAYGSYRPPNAEIPKSVMWIAIGDFAASFMAGIAIFSTLGYMALQEGVKVTEAVEGGASLAFAVFPKAISLLPFLPAVFGVIFFLTIISLAIDSAFSTVEAILTPIKDRFQPKKPWKLALLVCVIGFLAGVLYTSDVGLYILDIVDHLVVNYTLVLVGIFEALAVGFIFGAERLREYINERADFKLGRWCSISIKYVTPIFLTVILVWTLYREFSERYGDYSLAALIGLGLVPLVASPIASLIIDQYIKRRSAAPGAEIA